MKSIIHIADFYANEIRGGAELCNDALIKLLRKKSPIKKHIKIRRVYSSDVCRIDKKGGPYEVKLYE